MRLVVAGVVERCVASLERHGDEAHILPRGIDKWDLSRGRLEGSIAAGRPVKT
jgi:hypothetical protein